MPIPIGILQGRLSPSENGRFQFSPTDWEQEFAKAKELGFSSIEWLFDFVCHETNTLLASGGAERIQAVAEETDVALNSICADYFMKYRFTGEDAKTSTEILRRLINVAAKLTKQKLILIPLLEGNAPKTDGEKREIVAKVAPLLSIAERLGVRLGFETEMDKNELSRFLELFPSPAVGIYYDIGNATSYGYDVPADIRFFGKRIFGVHAKDRRKGSTQSVYLGEGDADYEGCLSALRGIGFGGTIIMQAWRTADYLSDAERQLLFLKKYA